MHPALRRLDLNLLLVFDTLYRHRTVARAAHELSISASAFSHALARLREALSDELFVRHGNRMHPTQRADALAVAVTQSLKVLSDQLEQWEPFEPSNSERVFVFAATDYTALQLLPPLLERLQQVAPRLCVKVVHSERKVCIEDLASGRIDFALGYGEDRDSLPAGVESEDWMSGRYCVIARRDHPRVGTQLDLQGYLAERHAVVTPWGEACGVVDLALQGMGLKRDVALQLPFVMLCPFIIARSDLLMTLPEQAARLLSASTDIVCHAPPFTLAPYTLRLYSHRKYARSDAHLWMAGQLRALFTQSRTS
ncbi:LysR family transcriptional regulator [Pseudomonas sp. Leaf127]|uniref:LysR family transcriptional regulator n=1 Tax=Pseudomonas sp. Leaf127 TaxID=1736267 RepID=UPI00070273BF|nr:LysR family transcriptional regulator [Pseudomonas sp. Leaf127]KQQ56272.1 LysR family transcriptional regulator [Pseudomonas sp. Leaf127]